MELFPNFDFDSLQPQEIPFKFQKKNYVLCEAPEGVAANYKNAMLRNVKFDSDGKPAGLTGGNEQLSVLLSGCIKQVNPKGDRVNVPATEIMSWPHKVTKPLFEKAKEISYLNEEETKESLFEKIQELKERIGKLDEQEAKRKNLQGSMQTTSATEDK